MRFACALALHAFEVATGLELGLFDQGRAERCSRELLMPAGEFLAAADESDTDLAGRFGVPVEQVAPRRRELRAPAAAGQASPD